MARKPKKQKKAKKKKEKDPGEPRQEMDAVKGFIVVMVVLIIALGVFIVITMGKLDDYESSLSAAKRVAAKMGGDCLAIQDYLKLMKDSGDNVLEASPEKFFGQFYTGVGVRQDQVTTYPQKTTPNKREKFNEVYWDLEMREINREQASGFLWGVEKRSPKARSIEVSMRRNKRQGDTMWDGRFRIGYRIPLAR